MEWDRLEQLLEKYWEGNSSLEEEKELFEILSMDELPDKYSREKELFLYYHQERKATLSTEQSESFLQGARNGSKPKNSAIRSIWNVLKVAAVITVIATAGWIIRDEMKQRPDSMQPLADTFEDPQQAFEETKKALMLLSKNISKGRDQAARFKAFNEAQEKARDLDKDENDENL